MNKSLKKTNKQSVSRYSGPGPRSMSPVVSPSYVASKPLGNYVTGVLPWQETVIDPNGGRPMYDAELSPSQRASLDRVLSWTTTVFSTHPGCTSLVTHAIHTPDRKVTWAPWKSIPFKVQALVNQEVRDMIQLDITEPSQSIWCRPIVLVPKLDRTVCFCVDYRKVNKLATFDACPMPQADILIGQLGKAQFLSALDLTKGY